LMLGKADGLVVSGSRASAVEHGISHEMLGAGEVRARFPGFDPPEDFIGLWEERAGLLFPEAAVAAQLALARQWGASIRTDSTVLQWTADPNGVRVQTSQGSLDARVLVLAAGPWIPSLLGNWGSAFQIERQLFHWFEPRRDASRWPVALWEHRYGGLFATLPDGPTRVKAGIHHEGEMTDPDTVNRRPTAKDDASIRDLLERSQPGAAGRLLDSAVCLYTNTPDHHFVIDWHPDHPNVLVVSPCSGHGFKFSSAIGEIVADLVTSGQSGFDLSPFSIRRFSKGGR
jgi:sarcosine oxidase